jgi:hypothetical protein
MSGSDATPWSLTGQEFVHCNRAYEREDEPIPAPPPAKSRAVVGLYIERGWYGEIELNGLSFVLVGEWVGADAPDGGRFLPIFDETANDEQRAALLAVTVELAKSPAASFLRVFPPTFEQMLDPVFAFIGLVIDVEGRRAVLKVPGFIDARGEPILSSATGQPRQANLEPSGAPGAAAVELGRGWASVTGPIEFETRDTYAQFAHLHQSGGGPNPAES